jgi:hypothetical protein
MTNLTETDELPVPLQPIEFWSENYCFDAFDRRSNVGVWMHLGRWSRQPALWREQTKIFLPDGSLVLWKTIGNRGEDSGPSSATLRFECLSPGQWELTFDGPGRHVTLDQLRAGALPDGALSRLQATLRFESSQPIWDLGTDADDQIWCTSHYEQHGRVTGTVQVNGEAYTLDNGSAYRDHSRGPRNMKGMRRHVWIHGQTDDNQAFGLFYMQVEGQRGLSRGFWTPGDGTIEEIEVVDPPYADTISELSGTFTFGLRFPSGRKAVIESTPVNSVISSFGFPYEKLHGVSKDATHVSCHQSTQFTVDGAPAAGFTERSFKL